MQLEAERANEFLQKEKKFLQASRIPPHTGNSRSHLACEHQSSHQSLKVSKWLTLSAQEQLAWVKNTQDPRIAMGPRSPMEKKILSLGGIHSAAAQKFLAKKYQEEFEAIRQFRTSSLDYQLSQMADYYYYSKKQDKIMEEPLECISIQLPDLGKKLEEETRWAPKKWDYLVNERELKQIAKHIYRTKLARNLGNKAYILYPHEIPRKKFPPRIWTAENKEDKDILKKPKTREQMRELEAKQIREHQKRMIHGRKVMQSYKERRFYGIPRDIPLVPKPEVKKEQIKLYEWVAAYPLLQLRHGKRLEIRILIEKSKLKEEKQEEDRMKLPVGAEFLKIPPFLKTKISKIN
ncbi:uncharacterized protein LOC141519943 [Macrotis lagotis]|uniref:uncharacterized protein LOC141519943 n=1 Tax=Macrotis lagotis TaxID=92651 RepID=UPI003D6843AB